MTPDYGTLKLLHLVGLALWLGYVPLENLMFFVVRRSRALDRRRRAMRWVTAATRWQEVPGILLVLGTGIGMAAGEGVSILGAPWFRVKLALLAALLVVELGVIHRQQLALERRFTAASTWSPAQERAAIAQLDVITAGGVVSFALVVGLVLVGVARRVPDAVTWLAVPIVVAGGCAALLVLRAGAPTVAEVLPDA